MKVVKALASASVLALAAGAAYFFCYVPYRCNLLEQALEQRTLAAWDVVNVSGGYHAKLSARRSLELMVPCFVWCSKNVNLYMIKAANLRILNRNEEAIVAYQHALMHDRRPEIYYNLGVTELSAGRREQAIQDLVMAGRSGGYWNLIEDPMIRTEVTNRLFFTAAPEF